MIIPEFTQRQWDAEWWWFIHFWWIAPAGVIAVAAWQWLQDKYDE